jgi:hypothetical protein
MEEFLLRQNIGRYRELLLDPKLSEPQRRIISDLLSQAEENLVVLTKQSASRQQGDTAPRKNVMARSKP